MNIKAKLSLKLMANNEVVAETNNEELWISVLQAILKLDDLSGDDEVDQVDELAGDDQADHLEENPINGRKTDKPA